MVTIEQKAANKLPAGSSLFVSFDYSPDVVAVMKTVENSIYDSKNKRWEIPVTSLADIIDKLSYVDDISLSLQEDKRQKKPKVFELGTYKTKPFDHQLEAIQYGLNHDTFLLLDAPGLGKTLSLICLAQELKAREGLEHCLIVCGINTLKENWKKEIQIHSNLSCRILGERITKSGKTRIGSVQERVNDLKSELKEFFIITNIETLRSDDILKALSKGPNKFEMIVVDEIHTCKSTTSQQGKHLLKLNKAKHRVGATGTLLLNDPADAYVPLKWIGAEKCSFSNFKYYYYRYGGQFGNEFLGYRNIKVLKDQLEKVSLRRTKDLLKLPPKTVITEYVELNEKQRKFYDEIKAGVITQVDKVHMSTASLLAMVARLRQATACPAILTSSTIESEKINRACDLAEQIIAGGDKVVIFSTFKETCNVLIDKLSAYKPLLCTGDVKDEIISERIDAFQHKEENKVFVATWQKCGTGITLTAASYAIFLDTPWTAGVFEQAQDRIHRIGTEDPVFIYNLVASDTIDERVLELVTDKQALSDYIVDDKLTEKSIDSLRKYIEELC